MPLPKSISHSTLRLLGVTRAPFYAASQHVRSYNVPHEVTFDQTKKGNDPKGDEDKSAKPQSGDKESHPQKQPDPQKSPSRSTGIETDGPGDSKAGKGS